MVDAAFKRNGVVHPLMAGQKHIKIEPHLSGGILIEVGQEGVILTPRQAFEMATGVLRHLGYSFEQKPVDLPG